MFEFECSHFIVQNAYAKNVTVRNPHACFVKELKHSFIRTCVTSICLQRVVSYLGDTVNAVNYLKSSLARLELATYHSVYRYCVMNL